MHPEFTHLMNQARNQDLLREANRERLTRSWLRSLRIRRRAEQTSPTPAAPPLTELVPGLVTQRSAQDSLPGVTQPVPAE